MIASVRYLDTFAKNIGLGTSRNAKLILDWSEA